MRAGCYLIGVFILKVEGVGFVASSRISLLTTLWRVGRGGSEREIGLLIRSSALNTKARPADLLSDDHL